MARLLLALAALVAVAAASTPYMLSEENRNIIAEINRNPQATWTAGVNEVFVNFTKSDLKNFFGTVMDKDPEDVEVMTYTTIGDSLPAQFDARTQWPNFIQPIRNQQKCGSCWAFGAAEAFSDRVAIATKGKINTPLSPQALVSCSGFPNQGCGGGIPFWAWFYIWHTGLPTDACVPYTSGDGHAPACAKKCADGSEITTHKSKKFYKVGGLTVGNAVDIQKEIMTNGPVEAAFTVYQDFMNYKSGVYKHTTGNLLGGHAIKLLGWGTENGQDYWLVANSWDVKWGEQGFFKIARGTNECNIERTVYGGIPAETA